ncbi:MAG: S9 family peptidase [Deltaproteobacteria bacterium]
MEMRLFSGMIATILFCGVGRTAAASEPPRLIPREVLFGNPTHTNPQVSPDGKMIAYLAPVGNVLNVWVRTIGKQDDRPVTRDTDRGIRRYFWSYDSTRIMYLQDKGGDENWRLYGLTLATGAEKDYTPFEKVQVRVVDSDKHFPDTLIIAMNKDDVKLHDAYTLSVSSGEMKMAARNPGNVTDWVCDTQLRVRGCMTSEPDASVRLLVGEPGTDIPAWKEIVRWSPEDSMSSGPAGFTKDGKGLYLLDSRGANASRLVRMDLATGKTSIIAADPQYDVSGIIADPDTYAIQAVSFTKSRTEWLVLDQALKGDFERMRALNKGDFFFLGRDNSGDLWTIGFVNDESPASFYVFDRKSKKAGFLFYSKPVLREYRLAPMEPVHFKSRDGLIIHGYITFPPGCGKSRLPMVLNVHGGPWARDEWGLDPEAQWLANRGYICLQVNYRGSSGYGKEFLNLGNKEWGGRMHDDLVDAVLWAEKKGYADPDRVAIYGGSYGGYAALVGAAFTPDLFRCAVDIVGPSNLLTFIRTIPPYWQTALSDFYKRVGNPETEKDFLMSRSPLFKADRIKIPLLIAQGANDPRVNRNESEQIVKELETKHIEHEYMLFPDEGHGFAKPQNRLKFYGAAEKFLARYLGGRYEGQ